jgi:hypothetical protein
MKRRDFIKLLGGAATWPLAARAQQPDRLRRIGILMNWAADNPEGQDRLAAFHQRPAGIGLECWAQCADRTYCDSAATYQPHSADRLRGRR